MHIADYVELPRNIRTGIGEAIAALGAEEVASYAVDGSAPTDGLAEGLRDKVEHLLVVTNRGLLDVRVSKAGRPGGIELTASLILWRDTKLGVGIRIEGSGRVANQLTASIRIDAPGGTVELARRAGDLAFDDFVRALVAGAAGG